ncbi:hypothetical protein [Texcoconibacillus texcoconensis]|uniref:Flagellar protein FliT n=1 Tax=Texcoconibacillus texcoconensis TaxID=1095777 RepID=A0A840QQ13_9BACI|nr:hypothetical protein [Texcoconibacillus texcoconensis]MBB5173407.1 flagellar protein FliT [Texcoconibacillus texcoconensis]
MATKKLYNHLSEPLPDDMEERERYLERMHKLLDRRGKRLEQAREGEARPETERDHRYVEEVYRLNQEIDKRMNEMRFAIRSDYNRTKQRRTTGNKYTNPYDQGTVDGVFFDKRN